MHGQAQPLVGWRGPGLPEHLFDEDHCAAVKLRPALMRGEPRGTVTLDQGLPIR
jgi:hypothetical protein